MHQKTFQLAGEPADWQKHPYIPIQPIVNVRSQNAVSRTVDKKL